MNFNFKHREYQPNPVLRGVQIFLLVLIIIGLCLLITQKIWVPKMVNYILKSEVSGVSVIPFGTGGVALPPLPVPSTSTPVTPPAKVQSGVRGIVTIGPTCPVVRYPDDGKCADKPYQTTLVIASTLPGKGGGILVHTDSQGRFSQQLIPGSYTVSAQGNAVMPRLSPVTFEVKANAQTIVNLSFDSGIR